MEIIYVAKIYATGAVVVSYVQLDDHYDGKDEEAWEMIMRWLLQI